eukprot:TRINITY_DN124520_c0_g1_i1.p1 TRINITY_DN124520_c0_g1~~TRINITY_DN124520_c0_g1_i1.p1  ORF type:complete len:483 (-),score=63.51 TRINITY_DN124520_c0_g1_i1:196-1644(-)
MPSKLEDAEWVQNAELTLLPRPPAVAKALGFGSRVEPLLALKPRHFYEKLTPLPRSLPSIAEIEAGTVPLDTLDSQAQRVGSKGADKTRRVGGIVIPNRRRKRRRPRPRLAAVSCDLEDVEVPEAEPIAPPAPQGHTRVPPAPRAWGVGWGCTAAALRASGSQIHTSWEATQTDGYVAPLPKKVRQPPPVVSAPTPIPAYQWHTIPKIETGIVKDLPYIRKQPVVTDAGKQSQTEGSSQAQSTPTPKPVRYSAPTPPPPAVLPADVSANAVYKTPVVPGVGISIIRPRPQRKAAYKVAAIAAKAAQSQMRASPSSPSQKPAAAKAWRPAAHGAWQADDGPCARRVLSSVMLLTYYGASKHVRRLEQTERMSAQAEADVADFHVEEEIDEETAEVADAVIIRIAESVLELPEEGESRPVTMTSGTVDRSSCSASSSPTDAKEAPFTTRPLSACTMSSEESGTFLNAVAGTVQGAVGDALETFA